MGILLLRRAIIAEPQPAPVVASGLVLAALSVGSNHGFLNANTLTWIGLVLVAGVFFGWWERLESLWK
jgi:hypothetical protein